MLRYDGILPGHQQMYHCRPEPCITWLLDCACVKYVLKMLALTKKGLLRLAPASSDRILQFTQFAMTSYLLPHHYIFTL